MKPTKYTLALNGEDLIFELGKFAHFSHGAALVRLGDTVVHATVVRSEYDSDLDYFPLYVEYQEKLYAGGIIKGSRWVKREGRPTEEATLVARLIDRSIRPLFPKDYKKSVQVIITVFSIDNQHSPDILAILAASAALAISDIPWQGPIAAVRIGLIDETLVASPIEDQRAQSRLDLVLSGTEESVVMVEAGANQVKEAQMLAAFELAQPLLGQINQLIKKMATEVGQAKVEAAAKDQLDQTVEQAITKKTQTWLKKYLVDYQAGKADKNELGVLVDDFSEQFPEAKKSLIKNLVDDLFKQAVRQKMFTAKTRIDGRQLDQIRPLVSEVGLFPRTHGSAMFKRGQTQAVTIVTLGSPSLEQLIESMEGEETKRYIHHYYMPPFSVGETGRVGWPSRREVGHGALAERALLPVIPDENTFPYTIRVVSEIMTSNGSTSMASVCGSTLSLMDAGVPIKKPVAGIAMGLVAKNEVIKTQSEGEDYLILTDIQGIEDHLGDMDFKVAGTDEGINALQMDIKIKGISLKVLAQALEQAKTARLFILDNMAKALAAPRKQTSTYAPKIAVIHVPEAKIGEVIGPGGRMIRQIIKDTETSVDVNDDGRVTIAGRDKDKVNQALTWVEGLTREVEVGEEFDGQVTRVENYGIFVEILPGKDGLVHVSRMSADYVDDAAKLYKLGDQVHVRVCDVDDTGRIALTMLTQEQQQQKRQQGQSDSRPSRPRRPYRR